MAGLGDSRAGFRAGAPVVTTLLGLDIGGTGSRARLCAAGEIIAAAQAPSASLTAAGPQAARSALLDLLGQLPVGAGHAVGAICAGSAGLSVPGARQFLLDHLEPLTGGGPIVIVDDVALVLPAAGLADGVAIICGTGSIAAGRYRDRTARSGGWGYLLGDEGGGYWVVREALRMVLGRRDRREPPGELGDRLISAVGADDLGELHRMFYENPAPRLWAGYAPQVLDSADPAAGAIISRAAEALAALAADISRLMDAPAGLPVVLAGGLSAHPAFSSAACRAVAEATAGEVTVLAEPPVAGAIRLAEAALSASRRSGTTWRPASGSAGE